MNILVTGGAGYIGSFMTRKLLDGGHSVVVADNGERGHEDNIDKRATFLKGDLLDTKYVEKLFAEDQFDGVIHFAGYISVGESIQQPSMYFRNNIYSVINLIEEMKKSHTNNFIFSSTAGVYGNPKIIPIPEDHLKNPESPYGESKLMAEKLLSWFFKAYHINVAILRYFNASGADLNGDYGEDHNPETHIIPNAFNSITKEESFNLFGDDYNTSDGTCIRDYIHVLDLVNAHILALEKLQKNKGIYTYNVGTGKGYSNKEVLDMIEKITHKKISIQLRDRRPGDADQLIADAKKIQNELSFVAQYSDLETIITSAWKWHSKKHV